MARQVIGEVKTPTAPLRRAPAMTQPMAVSAHKRYRNQPLSYRARLLKPLMESP